MVQDNSTMDYILLSLAIGVLITIIALPILWFVCYLNQHYKLGKKNIIYPLLLVALAGALRGVILQKIISSSELQDNLEPAFAILSSVIFTSIYFVIISAFMETVLQKRERFNQIFAKASLLVVDPNAVNRNLDSRIEYTTTLATIKERISLFDLGGSHVKSENLVAASKLLQNQINEVLRPLSHRLWINALGQVKHRSFLGITIDAIRNLDFNVKYILGYQLFVGGYGISLVLGFESALHVSIIGVITSAVLMKLFFAISERLHNGHLLLGASFLILIGLLPVYTPIAIRNSLNDSASALAGLLISPTLPGLILLVSAYRLVTTDRDFAIGAATAVKNRIASVSLEAQNVFTGVQIAEYLHNSLQSELFGISRRLESFSNGNSSEKPEEVVRSLEKALNRSYQDIPLRDLDVAMRIPQLISSWEGIADITLSGLQILEAGTSLSARASSVLEEMITNTIRYGEADEIFIELTLEASHLHVLLTHNGKGHISKKSGLGSLILARHSNEGVNIKSENGRIALTIDLPVG
jgi:signal transduction histidine kinase